MKKIPLFFLGLCFVFTSCTQDSQETKQSLLEQIAQSEEYTQMMDASIASQDAVIIYQLDQAGFAAYFEKNRINLLDVPALKDPELDAIRGAREYAAALLAFYQANDRLREAYPEFAKLSREDRLYIMSANHDYSGRALSQLIQH